MCVRDVRICDSGGVSGTLGLGLSATECSITYERGFWTLGEMYVSMRNKEECVCVFERLSPAHLRPAHTMSPQALCATLLPSNRKRSSRVAVPRCPGLELRSGQKLSTSTGFSRMSLWKRRCRNHT